jgi:hypothetical protein
VVVVVVVAVAAAAAVVSSGSSGSSSARLLRQLWDGTIAGSARRTKVDKQSIGGFAGWELVCLRGPEEKRSFFGVFPMFVPSLSW